MSRLIDADAVLQYLREKLSMFDSVDGKMGLVPTTIRNDLWGFVETILEQPTIAAPRWHRVEEPPKEEGRYWCAKKFAGHWIFLAAWYWNNVSDYTGVPVGEEDKADGFVFGEDVVYPDYWMPIEPPKEDA